MTNDVLLIRKRNREPAKKKLTMDKVVRDKGYYDIHNNWNSITTLKEYPNKYFRERVEVLIFNKNKQIFLCKEKGYFRVPGGSVERYVSNRKQVAMESKEEARIIIQNVRHSGVNYTRLFSHKFIPHNSSIYWDGVYNHVYYAEYKSMYDGKIKKSLKDNFMYNNGRFYDAHKVFPYLKPEYKKIISDLEHKGFFI